MKKNSGAARPSGKKQSKQHVRVKSAVKVGKKEGFIPFHKAVQEGLI